MPIKSTQTERSTQLARSSSERERGSSYLGCKRVVIRRLHKLLVVYFFWTVLGFSSLCFAQNLQRLQTSGSGITISGGGATFSASLGSVDGLGIESVPTGLTRIAVSGGEFFYTPYAIVVGGASNGHQAMVKAYLSNPLTNGSSILQLMSCPYPNACTTYGSYSALQSGQTNEIPVLPSQAANGSYTAYLGLFVGATNGSVTSSDTAQITFDCYDANNNHLQNHPVLNLSVTVATAIQLQIGVPAALSTAGIGSPVPDYAANFGNVNGLGIGPATGLTIVNGQVSNAALYTTSYTIQPAFSGFTSTTGKIGIYVSSAFAHASILKLYDSAASMSGYTQIPSSAGSAQITSVSNGVPITRYLGLGVSTTNGATAFTGSDRATLTYVFTVP